jgi:hypothetical protein
MSGLAIPGPVLGGLVLLLPEMNALIVRINPLVEGSIREFLLHPDPQLELFLFTSLEVFS